MFLISFLCCSASKLPFVLTFPLLSFPISFLPPVFLLCRQSCLSALITMLEFWSFHRMYTLLFLSFLPPTSFWEICVGTKGNTSTRQKHFKSIYYPAFLQPSFCFPFSNEICVYFSFLPACHILHLTELLWARWNALMLACREQGKERAVFMTRDHSHTREVLGRILHNSSTGDAGTFTLTICNRIKKVATVIVWSRRENI